MTSIKKKLLRVFVSINVLVEYSNRYLFCYNIPKCHENGLLAHWPRAYPTFGRLAGSNRDRVKHIFPNENTGSVTIVN